VKFTADGAIASGALSWATLHAYVMWSAWSILSLMMIISNRYMRAIWKTNQVIHSISGFLIFSFTVGGGVYAIVNVGFRFDSLHVIMGLITAGLGIIVTLGGLFTIIQRFSMGKWETNKIKRTKKVH